MSLASLLKKGELRQAATAIPATFAIDALQTRPKVARVATVAVANNQKQAANVATPLPNSVTTDNADRWCFPNNTAMTGGEIDTFAARLARFTVKGVTYADAEFIADRLVQRDRENDERRLCLECMHLGGYGRASWRCGNWQAAGIAVRTHDNQLPGDFAQLLQRCDGFTDTLNPTTNVS